MRASSTVILRPQTIVFLASKMRLQRILSIWAVRLAPIGPITSKGNAAPFANPTSENKVSSCSGHLTDFNGAKNGSQSMARLYRSKTYADHHFLYQTN